MKRLWVLRHAKAEPGSDQISDRRRPLARRGRKDAPAMGRWLAAHGGPPALIASSPALRALETARLFADSCGYGMEIAEWPLLYPGEAGPTLEALRGLDDRVESVLVVGHNPHVEELTALLCGGAGVRLAAGALALLQGDIEGWRGLAAGTMTLAALISPETL
jgi:phosphohistidine phosphatase